MRTSTLAVSAALGLGLIGLSGTAAAVECTADLTGPGNTLVSTTFSADGTSACRGPVDGNLPPLTLASSGTDFGFTDWSDSLERDNIGAGGEDDGILRISLTSNSTGQWMYTGTMGYTQLLLLVKGGNSFATFLVSGQANTWYDWYIDPAQSGGLSHMELYGREPGDGDCAPTDPTCNPGQVPEPGSLALLGLGLLGLGMSRRRAK